MNRKYNKVRFQIIHAKNNEVKNDKGKQQSSGF
jgi:hypothetical protein